MKVLPGPLGAFCKGPEILLIVHGVAVVLPAVPDGLVTLLPGLQPALLRLDRKRLVKLGEDRVLQIAGAALPAQALAV